MTLRACRLIPPEFNAKKVVSDVRSCVHGDEIIIGIDNTFLTPWVSNHSEPEILKKSIIWRKSQVVRPLTFGVDLVMHSCTKVPSIDKTSSPKKFKLLLANSFCLNWTQFSYQNYLDRLLPSYIEIVVVININVTIIIFSI